MTSNELDVCTLVAFHPDRGLLLTERGALGQRALPRISIPKYSRFAEEVAKAIRQQWCANAIVHFRPQLEGTQDHWAVVTLKGLDVKLAKGLEWSKEDTVSDPLLRAVLTQWNDYETGKLPGVFARREWRGQLESWVTDQIGPLGLQLTGEVKQYNASSTFALLWLDAGETGLWFKATGEPNRHEFSITRELVHHAPEFLPRIIAFHNEWNGWLMHQAEGEPIDVCGKQSAWTCAATSLANVQTRFLGKTDVLDRIGCRDRSLVWARTKIDPFFARAEEWMHRQPAQTTSQPMSSAELRELNARAHDLITELQASGIGETLVHGDINAGNIMVSGQDCVFLDWAEGWISHPFISFEYLRELLRRAHPDHPEWMKELYVAYALPWRQVYDVTRIKRTFALSPAIAALTYALVCAEGLVEDVPDNGRREAFLRSLIRRVDRETRDLRTGVAA